MLMEHVPWALVDLLNKHKQILDMEVIHIGESDFSRVCNKQQRLNVVDMMGKVKKLLKSVDTHLKGCSAVFFSHMVSLPWYVSWNHQRVARWAKACLNGAIAKCAQDAGMYVIPHNGLQARQGEGLYDINRPGHLSAMGNLIFLGDISTRLSTSNAPSELPGSYRSNQPRCLMSLHTRHWQ